MKNKKILKRPLVDLVYRIVIIERLLNKYCKIFSEDMKICKNIEKIFIRFGIQNSIIYKYLVKNEKFIEQTFSRFGIQNSINHKYLGNPQSPCSGVPHAYLCIPLKSRL